MNDKRLVTEAFEAIYTTEGKWLGQCKNYSIEKTINRLQVLTTDKENMRADCWESIYELMLKFEFKGMDNNVALKWLAEGNNFTNRTSSLEGERIKGQLVKYICMSLMRFHKYEEFQLSLDLMIETNKI